MKIFSFSFATLLIETLISERNCENIKSNSKSYQMHIANKALDRTKLKTIVDAEKKNQNAIKTINNASPRGIAVIGGHAFPNYWSI